MTIQIITGSNAQNLKIEGYFDDGKLANEYVYNLIKEGHNPNHIWLYAFNSNVKITARKLFRGFI